MRLHNPSLVAVNAVWNFEQVPPMTMYAVLSAPARKPNEDLKERGPSMTILAISDSLHRYRFPEIRVSPLFAAGYITHDDRDQDCLCNTHRVLSLGRSNNI